jgi:hypothetical protein
MFISFDGDSTLFAAVFMAAGKAVTPFFASF